MKPLVIFLLIIITAGCDGFTFRKSEPIDRKKLKGSWAGVYKGEYGEFHFISNKLFLPLNENHYYVLPENAYSEYFIINDSLKFIYRNLKLAYTFKDDKLILSDPIDQFEYKRFSISSKHFNEIVINGYMLRRCNFMVSEGYLTPKEANQQFYDYINEQRMLDTMDVEEEYFHW